MKAIKAFINVCKENNEIIGCFIAFVSVILFVIFVINPMIEIRGKKANLHRAEHPYLYESDFIVKFLTKTTIKIENVSNKFIILGHQFTPLKVKVVRVKGILFSDYYINILEDEKGIVKFKKKLKKYIQIRNSGKFIIDPR